MIKWAEELSDFLHRVIGLRTIHLIYLTRETATVVSTMYPLERNINHSNDNVSFGYELEARKMNDHTLFIDDNSKV